MIRIMKKELERELIKNSEKNSPGISVFLNTY